MARDEAGIRPVIAAALVVAAFLAYGNSFRNGFVWDDASSILIHEHVQDPSKVLQLFREDQHAFGRGQGAFYRPLLSVSFMADYLLSHKDADGPSPFMFHLQSILWHAAAALMFLALLVRLRAPLFVQAAAPLLYAVHPLHTEAVTYISGRGDPMSAALMLAALWFLLHPRNVLAWAAGALCFAGALLSKESALIFPVLLLVFVLLVPDDSTLRARLRTYAPSLAVSANVLLAYAILRYGLLDLRSESGAVTSTFLERLVQTGQGMALYMRVVFVPTELHMERTLAGVSTAMAAVGWALVAGMVGGLFLAMKLRQRRIALGIAWFLVTWFPISGLIPLNAPMAEHWLYLPIAGFVWALLETLWLIAARPLPRAAVATASMAALLALTVLTIDRNRDWRDNESLYLATLRENPASIRVHFNLAVTYQDIVDNIPGAIREYEAVLALHREQKEAAGLTGDREVFYPDEIEAHLSLGEIYLSRQEVQRAAEHFQSVLRVSPDGPNQNVVAAAAFGLGRAFMMAGRPREARQMFDHAVELNPALRGEVARIGTASQP